MGNNENISKIYLKSGMIVYLATVDGSTPRVRPLEFKFMHDNKLWFATTTSKDMYHQLKQNPRIEFAVMNSEYVTMRITGSVSFSDDTSIKNRIIDKFELTKGAIKSADNPEYTLFYMEHGDVLISYLNGKPDKTFSF